MNENRPVFTVSDINQYIKALLNNDESLKFIYVKGEISNFKMASNGHFYFSLKDDKSMIGAMMFSTYANKIAFKGVVHTPLSSIKWKKLGLDKLCLN